MMSDTGWTAEVHGKMGIRPCQYGDYHDNFNGDYCPECGWVDHEKRLDVLHEKYEDLLQENHTLKRQIEWASRILAMANSDNPGWYETEREWLCEVQDVIAEIDAEAEAECRAEGEITDEA
jgi:hypothetical protein